MLTSMTCASHVGERTESAKEGISGEEMRSPSCHFDGTGGRGRVGGGPGQGGKLEIGIVKPEVY